MKCYSLKTALNKLKNRYKWRRMQIIDFALARLCKQPKVLSASETIEIAISNNMSITRFGDGELNLICGKSLNFQEYDIALAQKMQNIFRSNNPNLLICVPDCFETLRLKELCDIDRRFWKVHLMHTRSKWLSLLRKNVLYGNTFISRIYSINWNADKARATYTLLEKLWIDRKIIIIEGAFSRLGVGNECFKKAADIKRILAPATNSFSKYNAILAKALEVAESDTLFVLALGPTATVMAADLTNHGYQSLDLGHIDIEYEWLRMGCKSKVAVPGKYSNEAFLTGNASSEISGQLMPDAIALYQSQIIADLS